MIDKNPFSKYLLDGSQKVSKRFFVSPQIPNYFKLLKNKKEDEVQLLVKYLSKSVAFPRFILETEETREP